MNKKNKTSSFYHFDEKKLFQELKNKQIQQRNESELQKVLNKTDSNPNLKKVLENKENERKKRINEIEKKKAKRRLSLQKYNKKTPFLFEFSSSQIDRILEKIDEKILWQDEVKSDLKSFLNSKRMRFKDESWMSLLFLWSAWTWKTSIAKIISESIDWAWFFNYQLNWKFTTEIRSFFWWVSSWFENSSENSWFYNIFQDFLKKNESSEELKHLVDCNNPAPFWIIILDEISKTIKSNGSVNIEDTIELLLNWEIVQDKNWKKLNTSNILVIMTSNGFWWSLIKEKSKKIWFNSDFYEEEENKKENILENEIKQFSQSFISRLWKIIYFESPAKNQIESVLDSLTTQLIFDVNHNRKIFENLNIDCELFLKIFEKIISNEKIDEILEKSEIEKFWFRKLKQNLSEELKFKIEDFLNSEKKIEKIWKLKL